MKRFAGVRCVFLDRDGVINRPGPGGFVRCCSEMELLPRSAEAIRILNQAQIKVIVVTNQRAVSLGLLTEEELARIHAYMSESLRKEEGHIDAIYHCPHDASCRICRKPAIGMFQQAFADFPGISAEASVTIGDSIYDMQAARRAGTQAIFISSEHSCCVNGYADVVTVSLYEAVSVLLASKV